MSGLFAKLISGEIPCHTLCENERFFSFLDVRPIAAGHALVIPRQEVDYLFDLEDDLLGGLLPFARPIAKAIERVVPCARVGVIVAGIEVPHAHVHLVPFSKIGDLSFAHARPAADDELALLAEKIRAELA